MKFVTITGVVSGISISEDITGSYTAARGAAIPQRDRAKKLFYAHPLNRVMIETYKAVHAYYY